MDPRLVDTSHNVWSHYKRPFCQMKFIYINNYAFYRYYKQNDFCLQFNALFFLSFILEHAKALYKLWLVLINSKGSDITSRDDQDLSQKYCYWHKLTAIPLLYLFTV